MSGPQTGSDAAAPVLAPELLERILEKLGFAERPTLDLAGLNELFAAYCGAVPFDNIRKRIWFAGDQTSALPGGDPTDFFESWLAYGTGGTCWPINGGFFALVVSLGHDARGIAGTIVTEELKKQGVDDLNHGSHIVTFDGIDYLADANIGSFKALTLVPGVPASTGDGIHDIEAIPRAETFNVMFWAGVNREEPLIFRMRPDYDPIEHAFFLRRYDASKSNELSPFNAALYITRRFPDSIFSIGRMNKLVVDADGVLTKTELTDDERKQALVEDLRIHEQVVDALPPDLDEPNPFF